jgi:proline iminopeptidase
MARSELYPEIQPYETGMLAVGSPHQIYWEQVGRPDGVPVLFLHGGPGAGANPTHRRFFDPGHYRTVIFDQRGSGRSRPLGETRDNTTPLLIEDIEALRRKLGIERWIVFGGSWGAHLRRPHPRGGAGRPPHGLSQSADRPGPGGAHAGCANLEHL